MRLNYLEACSRFKLDAFDEHSVEKLGRLAAAGQLKAIKGTKSAEARAVKAGLPPGSGGEWATRVQSSESGSARCWSSSYQVERDVRMDDRRETIRRDAMKGMPQDMARRIAGISAVEKEKKGKRSPRSSKSKKDPNKPTDVSMFAVQPSISM